MHQPSLFDSLHAPAKTGPENPEPVRRLVRSKLRILRNAERLPWTPGETAYERETFTYFAAALPDDEKAEAMAVFEREMARLEPTR